MLAVEELPRMRFGSKSLTGATMGPVALVAAAALSTLVALAPRGASGFYLPGTPPHDFKKSEKVLISTNSLTSTKTQIPMP